MRFLASTRIIDGSGVIVTLGLCDMTSAIIAPTWLFINVKPHMFDAVLSALNGLSAVLKVVVTGSAPSVSADSAQTGCLRNGSWLGRGRPRSASAWHRAATTAAVACATQRCTAAPTLP